MTRYSARAVERHIRRKHPGCPDFAVKHFAAEIAARDWTALTLGAAVGIVMQSTLRHLLTDYDQMLLVGVDRDEARRRVQGKVNAMINTWSGE